VRTIEKGGNLVDSDSIQGHIPEASAKGTQALRTFHPGRAFGLSRLDIDFNSFL
jgi:hypothetical protein